MKSALVNINYWEFTKGAWGWFLPTLVFLMKMLWPLWVIFGILFVFKLLFGRFLPAKFREWRNKNRWGNSTG